MAFSHDAAWRSNFDHTVNDNMHAFDDVPLETFDGMQEPVRVSKQSLRVRARRWAHNNKWVVILIVGSILISIMLAGIVVGMIEFRKGIEMQDAATFGPKFNPMTSQPSADLTPAVTEDVLIK